MQLLHLNSFIQISKKSQNHFNCRDLYDHQVQLLNAHMQQISFADLPLAAFSGAYNIYVCHHHAMLNLPVFFFSLDSDRKLHKSASFVKKQLDQITQLT